MASPLSTERHYKHLADTFSEISEIQVNQGKKLVKLLGVKRGDKVIEMGCATGEMASYITDQVGEEGEVLGIDPNQERIKAAVQKHCEAKRSIKFMVGDSSSPFPHHNEEYYDIHYSNFVFHWLTAEEKDVYIKAAFKCLKPGGRIAILTATKSVEMLTKIQELLPDDEIEKNRPSEHFIGKSVAISLLECSGFEILFSEYTKPEFIFPNLDKFLTWYCFSNFVNESKIVPHKKEAYAKKFVNDDGTVCLEAELCKIIARKIYS